MLDYTYYSYKTGFIIENGEKRPLTPKEQEKDRFYVESVIKAFIPKE